ncbi:OmpA family protein, partial [Vibrio cholerae]|nr:OmpA family protein [Vibrio cholerae]EJB8379895.1 OmpA family protein [Vibrio cholerae]
RFITENPLLIGYSGSGVISVKAPTLNSTTTLTNSIWGRTTLINNDPSSVQVVRAASPVTIQGLDAATLRGRVFLDINKNGSYEASEPGIASTIVKIECTNGFCLDAPQGTVFSTIVDANGGYEFSPGLTNIYASGDASGTPLTLFQGVVAGTWKIQETPPISPSTAIFATNVGTINGVQSGSALGREINNITMVSNGIGINYNFAERFLDGKIVVNKDFIVPQGVSGGLDFTFVATCDLPVANTQHTAVLTNYPTNTSVEITGVAADARCTISELLPNAPDNRYYWNTPIYSNLTPSVMPNGGVQSATVTNSMSPSISIDKELVSIELVPDKPTQRFVKYRITVTNQGTLAQSYTLTDSFGFDSDVFPNKPMVSASANVTGILNSSFTGLGSETTLIQNESIEPNTSETYEISTLVNIPAGSSIANNSCTNTPGNGLFNSATLSVIGVDDQIDFACENTPTIASSNLALVVRWINGMPGEKVSLSGTTGFSTNTSQFEVESTGSNSVFSNVVQIAPGEQGALPVQIFNIAQNANNYSTSNWICSDGLNPDISIPQGGSLTIPASNSGMTMTCTLTNASVLDDVFITKEILLGPTAVQGVSDQFDLTYRIQVKNANPTATVYSLSDLFGMDPDVLILSTTIQTSSNVTEPLNNLFTGQNSNTSIVTNESIEGGTSTNPAVEIFDINIRVQVPVSTGSTSNDLCNSSANNGLFNQATLTIASSNKIANACANTPTVPSATLKLQVKFIDALIGEEVYSPGTMGLTENTQPFSAVNTASGIQTVSSEAVTVLLGTTAILPTPQFSIPFNATNYLVADNWVCSDGVNSDAVIPFEGNFTLSDIYSGRDVTCFVTYSIIQVSTTKSASPTSGSSTSIGESINYTLSSTITGGELRRELILTDTLDDGLTVTSVPTGCTLLGQKIECTLPVGTNIGTYEFNYSTQVNDLAKSRVVNSVVTNFGSCSSCQVTHPLWNVVTEKGIKENGIRAEENSSFKIGDEINYYLKSTIVGGSTTKDVKLVDTLGTGLTLKVVPPGCANLGKTMECIIPANTPVGEYEFSYTALIGDDAGDEVFNNVSASFGVCSTCNVTTRVAKNVDLIISKTTSTKSATINDFVRYQIEIENLGIIDANNFNIIDTPASGLTYVAGSLNVVGDDSFSVLSEFPLTISGLDLKAKNKIALNYMMRVGASAGQGVLKNCAIVNDPNQAISSNRSCANIERTSSPIFEDTRILGTVFEDLNVNGVQDEGEPGLPGVRLATVEGLLIETDAYGRYHIEGIRPSKWARGSNFIVKVDISTLPEGSVTTTQNPLVKRLTQGVPGLFNFGFRVPFTGYEKGKTLTSPVVLYADGVFEFDNASLLEDGKVRLSQFVQQLKEYPNPITGLKVVGHTDRFGSFEYNQMLSTARALAVRDFLVSAGIDPEIIQTEGKGYENPLVTCPGNKNAKILECLAPNRRFEVTIVE